MRKTQGCEKSDCSHGRKMHHCKVVKIERCGGALWIAEGMLMLKFGRPSQFLFQGGSGLAESLCAWLTRVENFHLYKLYEMKKAQIKACLGPTQLASLSGSTNQHAGLRASLDPSVNEYRLFHGTESAMARSAAIPPLFLGCRWVLRERDIH